ncbi:unnamed protein product [Closterium sp. NIES-54]
MSVSLCSQPSLSLYPLQGSASTPEQTPTRTMCHSGTRSSHACCRSRWEGLKSHPPPYLVDPTTGNAKTSLIINVAPTVHHLVTFSTPFSLLPCYPLPPPFRPPTTSRQRQDIAGDQRGAHRPPSQRVPLLATLRLSGMLSPLLFAYLLFATFLLAIFPLLVQRLEQQLQEAQEAKGQLEEALLIASESGDGADGTGAGLQLLMTEKAARQQAEQEVVSLRGEMSRGRVKLEESEKKLAQQIEETSQRVEQVRALKAESKRLNELVVATSRALKTPAVTAAGAWIPAARAWISAAADILSLSIAAVIISFSAAAAGPGVVALSVTSAVTGVIRREWAGKFLHWWVDKQDSWV